MAYSGSIAFIEDAMQYRMVPRRVDLDFTEDKEALNAKVSKFGGDCRMEEKEKDHAIVDGTRQVDSLWFNVADQIQLKDCNCVVVSMVKDLKENTRKTYHVLIVVENDRGGRYGRVGVVKVEAQYVSRDCVAGTLR